MKKILTFAISFTFALPFVASAASFVVTPSSGSYTVGDTVKLNISVNPTDSTIYTAMLDARFSPETFEVVSFSLNDDMLPLKQSGYDALNNGTGVLTKTGGYTGGISSVASFGTLTLRAKGSGTGMFTVNDSSKLLDSNNTDKQSGLQTASFTIVAKAPVVSKPVTVPPVVSQKKIEQPKTKVVAKKNTQVIEKDKEVVNEDDSNKIATSTQLAAVAGSGTTNSMMLWMLALIAGLSIFGFGYFAGIRRSYASASK